MKCFFSIILSIVSFSLFADNVNVEEAQKVALGFLSVDHSQTRAADLKLALVWDGEDVQTRKDTPPAFYVFNCTNSEGFVIVAGDDMVSPILAYSHEEHFEVQNMPSNLKLWVNYYRDQINWGRKQQLQPTPEVVKAWESVRTAPRATTGNVVVSYATAKWDQSVPYNQLCPLINGQRTPTGCVATALAIMMQYNKWPDMGQGSYTYTTATHKKTLSATFNKVYDWSNMPDTYMKGQYTDDQALQVARLMYHCGIISEMDYTPAASGALTNTAIYGMINYMKYDKSVAVLMRDWYNKEEWNMLIQQDIDANGPVIYGGSNTKHEGHQFILDGYTDNDYYHVNWGWSGTANGYYLLSTLEPNSQGIGGNSGGGFSVGQSAVIGLKREKANSSYRDVLGLFAVTDGGNIYKGLSTNAEQITNHIPFLITVGYVGNYGLRKFSGKLVFALMNNVGEIKEFVSPEKKIDNLNIYNGIRYSMECVIKTAIAVGDKIGVFYKSDDAAEWVRVRGGDDVNADIPLDQLTAIGEVEQEGLLSVILDESDILTVKSPVAMSQADLYDINGRLLYKSIPADASTALSFSCSGYPTGVYILHITTLQGTNRCKFIKK